MEFPKFLFGSLPGASIRFYLYIAKHLSVQKLVSILGIVKRSDVAGVNHPGIVPNPSYIGETGTIYGVGRVGEWVDGSGTASPEQKHEGKKE